MNKVIDHSNRLSSSTEGGFMTEDIKNETTVAEIEKDIQGQDWLDIARFNENTKHMIIFEQKSLIVPQSLNIFKHF